MFKNLKTFFIIIIIFENWVKLKKKRHSPNSWQFTPGFQCRCKQKTSPQFTELYMKKKKYSHPQFLRYSPLPFLMLMFQEKKKKRLVPSIFRTITWFLPLKTLARSSAHSFFLVMDSEKKTWVKTCFMLTNYLLKVVSFVL